MSGKYNAVFIVDDILKSEIKTDYDKLSYAIVYCITSEYKMSLTYFNSIMHLKNYYVNYYSGYCYFKLHDINNAQKYFTKCTKICNTFRLFEIIELFEDYADYYQKLCLIFIARFKDNDTIYWILSHNCNHNIHLTCISFKSLLIEYRLCSSSMIPSIEYIKEKIYKKAVDFIKKRRIKKDFHIFDINFYYNK